MTQVKAALPDTRVTNLYYKNSIGIRLPDHLVAQQLLSHVTGAVVAPSANLANSTPPCTTDEVLAVYEDVLSVFSQIMSELLVDLLTDWRSQNILKD